MFILKDVFTDWNTKPVKLDTGFYQQLMFVFVLPELKESFLHEL